VKKVNVYTDGACSGNPGPGGWGTILVYNGNEKELSGGNGETTNNRMELTAAIEGLKILKEPCEVSLYSDSKYLVDAINLGWVEKWKSNGWMRNKKEKALNIDLWEELVDLLGIHKVEFIWVKGHNGHEYNERCDRMAVAEIDKFRN